MTSPPSYVYSPFEIVDASTVFLYSGILGKYQDERVLHKNIADSQQAGRWVPISGPFSDHADHVLDYGTQPVLRGEALEEFVLRQLARRKLVIQEGNDYYFAPLVIERVVEKYGVWFHQIFISTLIRLSVLQNP